MSGRFTNGGCPCGSNWQSRENNTIAGNHRCSVPGFLHLHSTEGLPDGQKEPLCSSLLPEPQSQALGTTEHPQVYMDMYGIFLRLLGADQFQIS